MLYTSLFLFFTLRLGKKAESFSITFHAYNVVVIINAKLRLVLSNSQICFQGFFLPKFVLPFVVSQILFLKMKPFENYNYHSTMPL